MKPDSKKRVYADASSLILLYKAGLLDLCDQEFRLILADAVFREITREGYEGSVVFFDFPGFTIRAPALPWPEALADTRMGAGETQTLSLFYEAPKNGFVLTDDGRAARFCKAHDLPFINALLVPKVLFYAGKLDEMACREYMDSLAGLGRYSQAILDLGFQMTRQDLKLFVSKGTL